MKKACSVALAVAFVVGMAAAAQAQKVNAKCPVKAGSSAKNNITTEYKGKIIGFCWGGCRGKFAANPAAYVSRIPELKPGYKPPPAPPKTANRRCVIDNRGINARYLVPVKKGITVGFCSNSCRGKFLRNPRPYLSKIPGLSVPGRSRGGAVAGPNMMDPKNWKGPCQVKRLVKGFYCADCKRELEQDDTRNGICKRCEKEPVKIDFCAQQLSIIFRAACHPSKTSSKPFRCWGKLHKTPEAPVNLARVLYECKTCKARGGIKNKLKHTGTCASSTTTIGVRVAHICTKSGKYPHVSRDAK